MAKRCGPRGCGRPRANWWRQQLGTDYYSSGSSYSVLLSEDFTGTDVDTDNGTISNPDSANITVSQNNKLLLTRTTDNAVASATNNNWSSVSSFDKGSVIAVTLNRDTGFTNSVAVFRWVFSGTTAFISVQGSGTAPGTIRLAIQTGGGALEYDFETGVSTSNRVKIVYTSDNEISFWYWNVSEWTQLGTTQTVDVGASGTILLSAGSSSADVAGDVFSFDQLRVTSEDYDTELPN